MDEQPVPPTTTNDAYHLRLLSIFHYVYGWLLVVCAFAGLISAIMMNAISGGGSMVMQPLIMLGVFGFLFGLLFALLVFRSGFLLARRSCPLFSQTIAGIMCLLFPFGTALGVYTLLVTTRPSVLALYDEGMGR